MRKRELDDRVKLNPLINELVRFKLHESPDMYEATILGFDEAGYWLRGGSLCEYLRLCGMEGDASSNTRYLEFRRIHWRQRVR
jgi:hypothetical protein